MTLVEDRARSFGDSTEPPFAGGVIMENLTKVYEDLTAVDNLSLAVAPGEFLCCLGPNGAV
jgi:ABC-type sugar transport system ATPase subunit